MHFIYQAPLKTQTAVPESSLLNCRCSTGTQNIMGTGRTVLSNTNDCQCMSIILWPAWTRQWRMGVEAFWISLGCPGGLPGCIHLQNTQGMGHPFHPWTPPKPPTGEMLSYQLNNGCAYKKRLKHGGCFISNLWGVSGAQVGGSKDKCWKGWLEW